MQLNGLSDGFFWVICGLGLLLVLTALAAVWSALRMAGQDDQQLDRTQVRRYPLRPRQRKELRKTDRL